MKKVTLIVSIIALILDQITKIIIESMINLNNSITIIKKVLYLSPCHNYGVAWSMLNNQRWIIIIISLIALYVLFKFSKSFKNNTRNNIAFGLIIGGLAGNLIDRIILGYVRDFIDIIIIKYDYPVFNIADTAIVIGVILLVYAIFKGEDQDENRSNGSRREIR